MTNKDRNPTIKTRLLRVFFYLLYNPWAWMYDCVAHIVSLGMWKQWVHSVVLELSGPLVLELGHGPGHLQISLAESNITVFGLDVSQQMGLIAYKRLFKENAIPKLVNGYAQTLPFHDQSFHQIVATFPSEFILNPNSISEAYRVLKPGGKLVILPVAWITGSSWILRAAAWLFDITNQAIPWHDDHLFSFQQARFRLKQKPIHHETWSLVIIIAEK